MALPYTQAVSGQPYKNNSGTIFGVTADSTLANSLTPRDSNNVNPTYGSKVALVTGVDSSGNIGAKKANSAGTFGKMVAGQYIAKKLTSQIAGVANTTQQTGASDVGLRRPIARFYGYTRTGITSWDYVTGEATFSADRGAAVLASGINGVTGQAADQATAFPGELVYKTGAITPVQDDYNA